MASTEAQRRAWCERGQRDGMTHMLVACDTFDWTDYPVYVRPVEQVQDILRAVEAVEMHRVMEVYDLRLPLEAQLQEYDFLAGTRAWHL